MNDCSLNLEESCLKVLGTFSEDEVKKICADLDKSKAVVFFFKCLTWKEMVVTCW